MDLAGEIQRQKSINRYLAQAIALAMQDPPVQGSTDNGSIASKPVPSTLPPVVRPTVPVAASEPTPPKPTVVQPQPVPTVAAPPKPAAVQPQPPAVQPQPVPPVAAPPKKRKVIFTNYQSPGDLVMLSAAIRDLHKAYPGQFQTGVSTSCDDLFLNNPYITKFNEGEDVERLTAEYPLIHQCNRPYHFIHGFVQFFEKHFDLKIPVTDFKGDVYLTEQEKSPEVIQRLGLPEHYWVVFAGGKYDFTAKWWTPAYYQEVVNHFQGRIAFVQCGESHMWPPQQGNYHFHPPLQNVVNLVGQTKSIRDLMSVMYHASGVLCPVTMAMHLAAAIPMKNNYPKNRPCVVLAGGREPTHWEMYPHHRYMNTNGCLDCCDNGGCWVSRCQKIGDGDEKDRNNLCVYPVEVGPNFSVPRCMNMIKPHDVIRAIEMYYEGGVLKQNSPKIGKKIQLIK